MSGNFVSDLIKAAVIDLLFKRPIQLQFGRDPTGKMDFRATLNPSSGSGQQPVVVMQQQPGYPYPGYPSPYPPPYAGYPPPYPQQFPQSPPASSGAPSPPTPPAPPERQQLDIQIPTTFRR